MDNKIQIEPIGIVNAKGYTFSIQLQKEYIPALTNIEGFSHLQVVWWGHLSISPENRKITVIEKPYTKGPDKLGVFATRSEVRPNPVLISTIAVMKIDYEKGIIYTPYIDAENGTPVIDIKPYHNTERIKNCNVPDWCSHWPKWYEEGGSFNWQDEFNF